MLLRFILFIQNSPIFYKKGILYLTDCFMLEFFKMVRMNQIFGLYSANNEHTSSIVHNTRKLAKNILQLFKILFRHMHFDKNINELFRFHPVSIQYLPFFKSENKKSVEKRVFLFSFFVEYFDVFLYTSLLPTFFAQEY